MSRVVRKYMPYFRKHVDAKAIPQHRQLKYSKEMSQKSKVVKALYILFINFIIKLKAPLGILRKNENKQEDKINILEHLTKYVLFITIKDEVLDETSNTMVPLINHQIHDLLLGAYCRKDSWSKG